jgi:outer membrane protein assembly factor BamB
VRIRSRFLLVGVLGAVAFGSSACWYQEGWDSGRSFDNVLEATLGTANVGSLHQHWVTPDRAEGAPVSWGPAAYELGFVPGGSGATPELYAFDSSSGAPVWATAIAGASTNWIQSPDSPAIGSTYFGGAGLVFADVSQYPGSVGNVVSRVVAVNTTTGVIAWSDPFAGVAFEGPLIFASVASPAGGGSTAQPALLVATSGGAVWAVDPATGGDIWVSGAGQYDTSAAVGNGTAYFGGQNGDLYSLDLAGGSVNWAVPVSPKCPGAILWFPEVDGKRVIVTDRCGRVAAFDTTSGKLLWRTPALSSTYFPSWVAVDKGQVVVAEGPTLYARADTNGSALWQTTLSSLTTGGPTIANGVVYVDDGPQLVMLDQSGGTTLGTITAPSGATFEGVVDVDNGQVLAYGSGMGLQAYGL